MKPHVWIIDDEPGICASLSLALKKEYEVRTFGSAVPALALLERESCDVVLLDLKIGSENGLDVLKQLKANDSHIAVIMMTAYGSIGSSVEAMKNGAFTYLIKPLDIDELLIFIAQAVEFRKLNEQVLYLSDALRSQGHYDKIIGESEPMQRVYGLIDRLKDVDANVLITGESGTGKELVAKAIHDAGKRRNERFVVVNCAAIPENLLELEFFGYKRGAFTGASQDRKGKFELADRGTIFLDEIGDMPINLQSKLLRMLQNKEFTPLGASDTRHVDVRVIAATNRDLKAMIAEQKFRDDLYYRLNVMNVRVPALRERLSDVPLLCEHFLKQFSTEMNKSIGGLSAEAAEWLMHYDYPGNVRQLANILEYAAIVSPGGMIGVKDFPEEMRVRTEHSEGQSVEEYLCSTTLKDIERRAIEATLRKNNGRRDQTALDLGISKRGLLNKINEYGLS